MTRSKWFDELARDTRQPVMPYDPEKVRKALVEAMERGEKVYEYLMARLRPKDNDHTLYR